MTDDDARIYNGSPEHIAYLLLRDIKSAEKYDTKIRQTPEARKWLLDSYAECLEAANGKRIPENKEI